LSVLFLILVFGLPAIINMRVKKNWNQLFVQH